MKPCHKKSHQDTAKYTGIQGRDAHDHGLTGGHGRGIQFSKTGQKDIHHIVHGKKTDDTAQCGDPFFFSGITYRYGYCEDDGQIIVDGIAHSLQKIEKQFQVVVAQYRKGGYDVLGGKGGSDAHQNTCDGKDHDRSHENLAQFLEL